MIRVAAVGDIHYDRRTRPEMRERFRNLSSHADFLLIAGDLTQAGSQEEARSVAQDLEQASVPVVAVLGNHDFHSNQQEQILSILQGSGVITLEGGTVAFEVQGSSVGIAGMKGFGGGFFGACISEFGESETKSFARHSKNQAEILKRNLLSLHTDFKFALLHFSPVEATLLGERREIYPFLGSYLLAEAIDEGGADAAFHGHAHHGVEKGATPGGTPVRNVALTVIRHAYKVYSFDLPRQGSRKHLQPSSTWQPTPAAP